MESLLKTEMGSDRVPDNLGFRGQGVKVRERLLARRHAAERLGLPHPYEQVAHGGSAGGARPGPAAPAPRGRPPPPDRPPPPPTAPGGAAPPPPAPAPAAAGSRHRGRG